ALRTVGRAAARADPAAGRALRDRPRRARTGPDVGDRARRARQSSPARGVERRRAGPERTGGAAAGGPAVCPPPDLLPGGGPPDERRQGPPRNGRGGSGDSPLRRRARGCRGPRRSHGRRGRAPRLGSRTRERSRAAAVKALVTGAAGFIGSHVVAALASSGAQVRAFDRRAPADLPPGAEFAQGDLLDREALRRALAGCDAVFPLAALYSYSRRDVAAMERINVEGTRTLIEEAGSRRIVHTASCATCGPVDGRAATEADRPAAWELRVPYKRTKIAGERLALDAAARGANIVVVNPTTT